MSKRSKLATLGAAGLLLAALPVPAKTPAKVLEVAVIENSGSTNSQGYRILINLDFATPAIGDMQAAHRLPLALRRKLFRDLHTAMPLTSLPVSHGMRSASFGTRTTISYRGQTSPDLTFTGDSRTAALKADVDEIIKTLHVGNVPRRPVVPVSQSETH